MQAEGMARTQNESIIAARVRAMDAFSGGGRGNRTQRSDATTLRWLRATTPLYSMLVHSLIS
jgi:hypothetical protein